MTIQPTPGNYVVCSMAEFESLIPIIPTRLKSNSPVLEKARKSACFAIDADSLLFDINARKTNNQCQLTKNESICLLKKHLLADWSDIVSASKPSGFLHCGVSQNA
ncbi:unnamed protein product [Protopolystoma xenopodis]|uniref:Uncharacterized protein n=1 Tax=Protopolystoma xenopodis TaxID=117903 RepID=A0A448WJC0_9PLAT|nr:unnamed protein product [Protopolystoma xenopodis]